MVGYRDDDERTSDAMRDGYYHTGDVASRDADGYITYVGRTDDVFKASDYRISPFELESVLIEHEAVAEAAVVPSPDPLRLAVPKAYVVLAAGWEPDRDTALSILRHCARAPRALQAHPPARVRRAAQDDQRQDPPRRAARARRRRLVGGRLPRAQSSRLRNDGLASTKTPETMNVKHRITPAMRVNVFSKSTISGTPSRRLVNISFMA